MIQTQSNQMSVDIPEGADAHVDRFFALAQQDVTGFDSYARKVRKLFADSPATLEHVLDALFEIATADGFVHGDEMAYLEAVSEIFGFDSVRFEQIASQHVLLPSGHRDPYAVLGLAPDVTDDELRRAYRRLVAEHHPDRMVAKGVPEELMGLASAKMASINTAYRDVTRARGTRPAAAARARATRGTFGTRRAAPRTPRGPARRRPRPAARKA